MKTKVKITGMTCAACVSHVEKAAKKVDGIKNVNVNLLKNTLTYESDKDILDNVSKEIIKVGYGIKNKQSEKSYDLLKIIISVILLIMIMYFSMLHTMLKFPLPKAFDINYNPVGYSFMQFLLTIPICIIYKNILYDGFKRLIKFNPNMDSLILIGSSFSLIYGIISIFMISLGYESYKTNLYFEACAMILTFVSIGKYIEKLSKSKTTKSLEGLINLSPKEATILINGKEEKILATELKVNDIVIVKNGDIIPCDGIVIDGFSEVDEQNITGESKYKIKNINDEVFESSINYGYLKIKALKVGEDTQFKSIINLVEEASISKAKISRLADTVSKYFIPVVLIISLLTFIINLIISRSFELSFNFAITVIVIACPCALGLATPVAIMVGTGKGAINGLLIKNANILEGAKNIKTIVFDKTGTLTYGMPSVDKIYSNIDILDYIYSIELLSEHPISRAIIDYGLKSKAKKLDVLNLEIITGKGIKGIINNDLYLIGNKRLMEENNIDLIFNEELKRIEDSGNTPIYVSKNNKHVSLISIKDKIREESKLAIKELKKRNINVVMLTGDDYLSAKNICDKLEIDNLHANLLPQEKYELLNSFKRKNNLVAYVGDGVNDTLAISSADIGITLKLGSDVVKEKSDIILIHNNLFGIINVIDLSKRVINTIKFSLFWAFFYNIICIILSTGIFYYLTNKGFKLTPMIASALMSISSVTVVLSALTINLKKFKKMEENKMEELVINVEGMMCQNCVKHVKNAVEKVNGVKEALVSLENKCVTIKGEDLNKEHIINEIKESGYNAF